MNENPNLAPITDIAAHIDAREYNVEPQAEININPTSLRETSLTKFMERKAGDTVSPSDTIDTGLDEIRHRLEEL